MEYIMETTTKTLAELYSNFSGSLQVNAILKWTETIQYSSGHVQFLLFVGTSARPVQALSLKVQGQMCNLCLHNLF